jgi:phospholipid transport system transporter-binding protein
MLKKMPSAGAGIVRQPDGQYRINGELDFDSVPTVLAESKVLFGKDQADLIIDLSGMQRGNSAALGLMLEWINVARQQNRQIRFRNVPDDLIAIAHVSDLDSLLPVEY